MVKKIRLSKAIATMSTGYRFYLAVLASIPACSLIHAWIFDKQELLVLIFPSAVAAALIVMCSALFIGGKDHDQAGVPAAHDAEPAPISKQTVWNVFRLLLLFPCLYLFGFIAGPTVFLTIYFISAGSGLFASLCVGALSYALLNMILLVIPGMALPGGILI